MDLFVVFVDSNPADVKAFFLSEAKALEFRDNNFPAGDVKPAKVSSYILVDETIIPLA